MDVGIWYRGMSIWHEGWYDEYKDLVWWFGIAIVCKFWFEYGMGYAIRIEFGISVGNVGGFRMSGWYECMVKGFAKRVF